MDNFWAACLGRFEEELSPQQFNTWIKPLHFKVEDQTLTLFAPNRFVQQWVKDRFLSRINEFAKEKLAHPITVDVLLLEGHKVDGVKSVGALMGDAPQKPKIKTIEPETKLSKSTAEKRAEPASRKKILSETSGLNPTFKFDNFVTGKANQLARAAAVQIAENPGNAYNPLFIYGGVGLGKTHLLQAIGNHLKVLRPEAKIKYLHAERYVSDVVKAYENKAFDEFKRLYHSLDMLLIDDIQFFAKKTRTQEEFF